MKDYELLQKLIDESSNIVFFGGAGVSTDSGLKSFRGKDGLYSTNYNGRTPEYMLSNKCLYNETELFFDYYRNTLDCSKVVPNVTHKYLTKLEKSGKLKAIVTQNIDGLHQKAGSKNVLEIHGTTFRNYCDDCNKEYPSDYIFKSKKVPLCSCGGIIRPGIVLYGESLPKDFELAIKYIAQADLLIVAGTSLTVYPASSLIEYFKGKNLVIINNDKTPYDYVASLVIHKPLKDIFSKLK